MIRLDRFRGLRRRPSTTICEGNERRERIAIRLTSFERFIYERDKLIGLFDSFIYLEPVERFKNRSSVMN